METGPKIPLISKLLGLITNVLNALPINNPATAKNRPFLEQPLVEASQSHRFHTKACVAIDNLRAPTGSNDKRMS